LPILPLLYEPISVLWVKCFERTENIFMANEPLMGKRLVEITESKTKIDWAKFVKRIADQMYPDAKKKG
jgi:hypothetical protein